MSTTKQDIAELVTIPLLNAAALTAFNVFFEKRLLPQAALDGALLGGSTLATDLAVKLVYNKVIDTIGSETTQDISQLVAKPVINAVAYKLIYDMIFKKGSMNYLIGAAGGVSLTYLKNPLVSFLTNMSFV